MRTGIDIARQRLHNQHIAGAKLMKAGDVVRWLGAVQGQEYLQTLWAIGMRMREATEADVERAIADKSIVRTWFMRGTLHFVAGEDLRWMVRLLAPRMRMFINNVGNYQKLELDEELFAKCNDVIVKALQGGKQLMRTELEAALGQAGIEAKGVRLSLLLQRAQSDGLTCYGVRRGRQVTFALVDEWLPPTPVKERDEALAEFSRRFYMSHGPATAEDFVWWSRLTKTEARAGLEMVASQLAHEVIDGQTYWFSPSMPAVTAPTGDAYLLPDYDEYFIGYRDRSAMIDPALADKLKTWGDVLITRPVVIDGQVAGHWERTLKKSEVIVKVTLVTPMDDAGRSAIAAAVERYGRFLGLPATLRLSASP